MREKSTRSTTDNEREKENVLGIVVGKRQCVSNMGRARALCWITIIGYWNLRPQVATAQEMIGKGKYWLLENQDEQIWKQLFSKGVWFLMDRTTNPYGRKTYEGPKLLKSNVCTLIHDFHQNREWVILTEYAYNGSLPAYHLVCLFIHLFSFVVYSYERKSTPHCMYRTWPEMWAQLLFSKSSYFLIFCFFSSWLVRDFKTQSARPLFELLSNCFSVISSFDVGKDCTCKFMQ